MTNRRCGYCNANATFQVRKVMYPDKLESKGVGYYCSAHLVANLRMRIVPELIHYEVIPLSDEKTGREQTQSFLDQLIVLIKQFKEQI